MPRTTAIARDAIAGSTAASTTPGSSAVATTSRGTSQAPVRRHQKMAVDAWYNETPPASAAAPNQPSGADDATASW